MATTLTDATTYGLACYYADLKRIAPLSDEERRHLVTCLATPHTPSALQEAIQVKHRLIEDHLRLAIALCPPACYHTLLPDLMSAANLAVVEATMRCNFSSMSDFKAYLTVTIRGAIKCALATATPVKIAKNGFAWARAQAQGTLEQFSTLTHMLSLDQAMQPFETDQVREPAARPFFPSEAAPARDPVQRAQVETLLSCLSPRAQAILRLRYGLSEDNERAHTTREIAQALGMSQIVVCQTERDALLRLRALVTGQATIITRRGKPCLFLPGASKPTGAATLPPREDEREARLLQTYRDLRAQGLAVSGRLLAKVTGIPLYRVWPFLRAQRDEISKEAWAGHPDGRLEEVCRQLDALGRQIITHNSHPSRSKRQARRRSLRTQTQKAVRC